MTRAHVIVDAIPLVQELKDMGFIDIQGPMDRRVMLPHVDWLREFGGYLQLHKQPYVPEAHDCDNFASEACDLATQSLLQTGEECGHSVCECSLSIAEGEYLNGMGPGGGHACNVVKCADLNWYFFEPQNGRFTPAVEAINQSIGMLLTAKV